MVDDRAAGRDRGPAGAQKATVPPKLWRSDMPIEYDIDLELGLLAVVGTGTITDDDLTRYKDALASDPRRSYVTREISDFRSAIFSVSPARMPEVAKLHGEVFAGGRPTKCAVLVSGDLMYGLVRMYAHCIAPQGHEVVPFRDVDEAREWLGIPACRDDDGAQPD